MNAAAVATRIAAVWASRRTTAVCLILFAGAAARGLWLGAAEQRDYYAQVRVRLHYQSTTARDIAATGRALLATVRDHGRQALLIGPWQLAIACRDAASGTLRITLAWESSPPDAVWRVVDDATGTVRVLDQPVADRCVLTVPLPHADTTLHFLPSLPSLGVRILDLALQTDGPPAQFSVEDHWQSLHRDASGSTAIGAGFLPRSAQCPQPYAQRFAWLRIDPAAPGPYRLHLAVHRSDPGSALPIVTLGGRRIWCAAEGTTVWSRATTQDGVTDLLLEVELATTNVIGLECPGPLRSGRELGVSDDPRRVAYLVSVARCEPVPPK